MDAAASYEGKPFPPTRWSLIARGREALAPFFEQYRPALKAHLVFGKRIKPDQADDLIQGFVTSQMIEKDLLGGADRARGKFRTYLLTALDRFVVNEYHRQTAQKRSPGEGRLLDVDEHGHRAVQSESADAFDVAWARQVLDAALTRMREECEQGNRGDVWGVFDQRLLRPLLEGQPAPAYEQLVERFNLKSPAQASNLLITAKRQFGRTLQSVVAQYADSEAGIEQEIDDLIAVLARAGAGSA